MHWTCTGHAARRVLDERCARIGVDLVPMCAHDATTAQEVRVRPAQEHGRSPTRKWMPTKAGLACCVVSRCHDVLPEAACVHSSRTRARACVCARVRARVRAVPAEVSDLAIKDEAHRQTFSSANSERADQ